MAFKREKTIANAQKLVRKGSWDRAIKEYLSVLEHDPGDERTRLKVADLHVKGGKLDEALEQYRVVAKQYADDDFNEKAVAVYKQALRIAPEDPTLHNNLGEAYYRLGRAKDALRSFAKAERAYKDGNNVSQHREVLERMVDLDPENVGIQIQLAERFEKDGGRDEALARFKHAATILREEGRLDEYVQVAERMIFLSPDLYELRKEVVRIYLGRSDNRRALKHLQYCFKHLPQDIETLELLGTTFHRLGNNDRALLVYIELAQIYDGSGQRQRALDAYRTILSFDPHNREALSAINANKPPAPKVEPPKLPPLKTNDDALDGVLFLDDDDDDDVASAFPSEPTAFSSEPTASSKANDFLAFAEDAMKGFEDLDLSGIDEIPMKQESAQHPAAKKPPLVAPVPDLPELIPEPVQEDALSEASVVDEEKLEQYLNESDVFLKYGLLDRAEDVITRVLRIDPNHVFGRTQMRKLLEKQGDVRGAAHQMVEIARIQIEAGEREEAADALQQAAVLTGDPKLVKSMAGSVGIEIEHDGSIQLADVSTSFIRKVNIGLDEMSSSMFDIDLDIDPATTGSEAISYQREEPKHQRDEPTAEDLAVPGHASSNPNVHTIDIDLIESEVELDIDSVAFDDDALLSLDADESTFGFNSEAADEMFDGLFGQTGSMNLLGEVDFYLEQGLVSEAEDALEKIVEATPDYPGISERRGQIDVFRGGGNPFGANSLTHAFRAIGAPPNALSEATESPGEFQNTHLELGQTYFEMGLFQEALEEFEHALEDETVAPTASFNIALCMIELGNSGVAKTKLRELMNDQSAPPQLRLSAGEKLAEI